MGFAKWALLALAVLVAAGWIWSMFRGVTWRGERNGVVIFRGAVELYWSAAGAGKEQIWWMRGYPTQVQWWVNRESGSASTGPWECVGVPLWMVWVPLLMTSGVAWRVDAKYRDREKANLCSACGYALAGLAREKPCPECGAALRAGAELKA